MKKFEYVIKAVKSFDTNMLNEMGNNGWELCNYNQSTILPINATETDIFCELIFKREIIND